VELGVGLDFTVGNRPAGSVAETPVPVSGGSVDGAGSDMATPGPVLLLTGVGVVAATTVVVADPVNDVAPDALAFADRWTCSPPVAADRTRTVAWSSSAWPTGRLPILQEAPLADGQTVKAGASMCRAVVIRARTETPAAAAFVVQTQITKPAL